MGVFLLPQQRQDSRQCPRIKHFLNDGVILMFRYDLPKCDDCLVLADRVAASELGEDEGQLVLVVV